MQPAPATETELKLALEPAAVRRLTRAAALTAHRAGRGRTSHLVATYFDTPDRALRAAGGALRVRRHGDRFVQTLKLPTGDPHARQEWEVPLSGAAPDLSAIAGALAPAGWPADATVAPLFTTDVRRTAWLLRLPDGSTVEAALDRGAISAGTRHEDLCELELELKSGDPAALYDLALALLRDVPLRLEARAKSDRGYALADGPRPLPKPPQIGLAECADAEAAFKAIARACLLHLGRSEAAAMAGQDIEGVHQVRVALRRLRSAFVVFRPVLPPLAAAFAGDLRDLATACGPARDWDVFAAEVLRPLRARQPDDEALDALAVAVERAREQAYARVRAALLAPAHAELQLRLGQWLATPFPAAIDAAPPLAAFADAVLHRRYRRLKRRAAHLDRATTDELHELRIEAKKLRYAAEFFRSLYRRRPARQFIAALARLQDILGVLNDAAVGAALLGRLEAEAGLPPRAAALVEGWYAGRLATLLPGLPAAWDAFADVKRFWSRPAKPWP